MNKRLFNQQNLTRKQKQFSLLLSLLLLPLGTWAEDYNLTVGGVQVTDANATSGITGDNITGSVTFDATSNTLTLNNATINGYIMSSLAADLTVHLVGTNVIHNGEYAFSLAGNGGLNFSADSGAKLLTDATTDAMFAYSVGNKSAIELGDDDLPNGFKLSYDAELKRSIGESYDVLIYAFINGSNNLGPQCITSANCDRLAGAYDETTSTWNNNIITLSYDYATTTLTLNNMNLETASPNGTVYFITCDGSKAQNITINLLGENKLRQFKGEEGARFIYNGAEDGSITIITDQENPGMLTMPDLEDYLEETDVLEMRYGNHVNYKNGLGYVKDENNVRYIKTLPSLGLTVAGVTVNESNAANVLDEVNEETELPTVSYDAENNILTLNNAWITVESEDAIVSSLKNLTLFLVGENGITCYGERVFNKTSTVDEATIAFTTDEESNGSLIIMGQLFGEGVTPAYTNLSLKDNGDTQTIDSRLGISVGGVDATIFNTDDVLGDGKVSYNAETHTLTLNGATIETEEETAGIAYSIDEADLTIALIGNNSVRGGVGCSAIQKLYGVEMPSLSFAKGDETQHFSLTLIAESEDGMIDGFNTNYGDFYVFDDVDDGIYTKTICTGYGLTVGDVFVYEGNAANIFDGDETNDGKVSYNATTNTLTLDGTDLSGWNISYEGTEDLTIALKGNSQVFSINYNNDDVENVPQLLLVKAEGANDCSLTLNSNGDGSVISGFSTVDYGMFNTLSSGPLNYGQMYPEESYVCLLDAVTNDIVSDVTITTATTYTLWVESEQVTAENADDLLNDGDSDKAPSVSFTPAVAAEGDTPASPATLTLNGVSYSPEGTTPFVVSGLDNLTVKLAGSNSVYVSSGADFTPEAAFVSTNPEAVLTFTTEEPDRLQPLNTNTIELASGFANIAFTGTLYRDQNMVKNLLAPRPGMSEGYLAIYRAGYEPDATTFNYEIEYADGSESANGTYDMLKEVSENNIVLDKPCTVTVYAQYGTVKSAEKVGKLFGFADGNELNVTYGTTQVEMPALVPAIAEADGITISREGNFVDDDKTMIDLEGKTAGNAATTIITSLTSSDNTPYILLNTIVNLSINITKATPTITFAQESYSATLGETFISPATVDNWTVSPTVSSNTSVANISEGQIVLVGVGTTTITVTYAGNDNYNSTTASYLLVVSRALDVAFVGSNLWASYYATENLSIPENLTAYVVDDVDETSGDVTVSQISYIPEYNAVLLKRADGASANGYVAAPYTGTTSSVPNLLSGSDEAVDISGIDGGTVYVLYNDMFKRATSGTIPARRGYLVLSIEPQVSRLDIVFDDTSTAISTLAVDDKGEVWYSVDGRKLNGQPQRRGLYIKNGKKVFVTNNK